YTAALRLNGQDAKTLVADYDVEGPASRLLDVGDRDAPAGRPPAVRPRRRNRRDRAALSEPADGPAAHRRRHEPLRLVNRGPAVDLYAPGAGRGPGHRRGRPPLTLL